MKESKILEIIVGLLMLPLLFIVSSIFFLASLILIRNITTIDILKLYIHPLFN